MSKEKANDILLATSDIASHQKRSEQLRSHNSQLEEELQYRDNAFNQRKKMLGECEVSPVPHLTLSRSLAAGGCVEKGRHAGCGLKKEKAARARRLFPKLT